MNGEDTKLVNTEVGNIPIDWIVTELENVVDSFVDYRGKTPKKTESGIPLVTAKIVKNGFIDFSHPEYIAKESYDLWMTRGLPKPNDVVLTTEAPLGEVAQLPEFKIALAQRIITLRGKENTLDNTYLKYYLMSPTGKHQLKKMESGSVVTGIKQSELRKIKVLLPKFQEQIKIAGFLDSIDSQIQTNQSIISTLNSVIQTIFKDWFVNFNFQDDAGKPYRTNGGKMIETEYGEIPYSWRSGFMADLVERTVSGGWGEDSKKDNLIETYCIRGADIERTQKLGALQKRYLKPKELENRKCSEYDLVVEISGGSPTQSTGRSALLPPFVIEYYENTLICSNFCRILRTSGKAQSLYLSQWFEKKYDASIFFNYENGTTGIKNLD